MRVVSISLTCAAAAAILALAPAAGTAKQARSACDISGKEQDLGASYVTSVKARNVGCGKALKVVIAYNECRKDNGGSDSRNCPDRVRGYSCNTRVLAESPAQFDAKFNCKNGDKKVKGTYTQNI
jgi:hypothetical protein